MTARPFLSRIEQVSVGMDRMDALAVAVQVAPEAAPRDLVALASGRLQRLADHLDMLACLPTKDQNDAVALACFLQPQLEEVCNLLHAVEAAQLAADTGGAPHEET